MSSRQSRRSRSRVRPGDVALAAWTVLVYAFLFIPILFIVVYSFNRGRALVAWKGFGTNWYAGLLGDHAIVSAIQNSLKAGVGAALIATVLARSPATPSRDDPGSGRSPSSRWSSSSL